MRRGPVHPTGSGMGMPEPHMWVQRGGPTVERLAEVRPASASRGDLFLPCFARRISEHTATNQAGQAIMSPASLLTPEFVRI